MIQIYNEDARRIGDLLEPESVQCVVTSPPYFGLRDYGVDGQIGLEQDVDSYVQSLLEVFRGVRNVLRPDGTLWLNLGDSYAQERWGDGPAPPPTNTGNKAAVSVSRGGQLPPKNLMGIPWRVAFALQADGWYLRSDIIWAKPNPMPESVTDRPTKAHEYLFLLTKEPRYYYDANAIAEPVVKGFNGSSFTKGKTAALRPNVGKGPRNDGPTRNKRSVWTIATRPYPGAHFAAFPETLVEPCILAGSRPGDIVLDPFAGSGTTLAVANRLQRRAVGFELNPNYIKLIERRLSGNQVQMVF